MDQLEELGEFLKDGCQRMAVAQVLRKPMIPSEILQAAQVIAPRIQLRDVWFILKQFKTKGLVICLNPNVVTGKLFCFSDWGQQVATRSLGIVFPPLPEDVDWDLYSWVVRGSVRKSILLELEKSQWIHNSGLTPSQIKRRLRDKYPIAKNLILRALKDLELRHLVNASKIPRRGIQGVFRISHTGQVVAKVLGL